MPVWRNVWTNERAPTHVKTNHCDPHSRSGSDMSVTVHYTQCTIHYTLHTIQCTLYSIHCTLYNSTVHYTLHTMHYTLYSKYTTLTLELPSLKGFPNMWFPRWCMSTVRSALENASWYWPILELGTLNRARSSGRQVLQCIINLGPGKGPGSSFKHPSTRNIIQE